jgi:NAD(P)-dependent dehydrogenase (short-subunit alcohol dehydrogenase family)
MFLPISLDDLSTIKLAAEKFKGAESRLDVLFNNAGVSNPPKGSVGAQGQELQLATNCLGPYLFTQLLLPVLTSTAKSTDSGAVRVIWTSSIAIDFLPLKSHGPPRTDHPVPRPTKELHNF